MALTATYAGPSPRTRSGAAPIVVYGNRWCGITQMIRRYLDRAGVPYDYVDLDRHPEVARRLRWMAGGSFRNPVVYVDGTWLEQPTTRELAAVMSRLGW